MHPRLPLRFAAVVLLLLPAALSHAQPADSAADQPADQNASSAAPGNPVTSQHTLTLDGKPHTFTASAGTISLRGGEDNDATATIFHVAYTLDTVDGEPVDRASRPVSFFFNGGPGSSSVWLHLGAFGPFRAALDDDGIAAGPPYPLTTNPSTLLPVTDLVFIDPVTTGYSRPAGDTNASAFRSVSGDINSVAQFIRRYLSTQQRWASPVYIGGESYGTTRAAGLAERLQDRHGIYPNGVILVSSVLHFQTIRHTALNDTAYATFLPTYTAAAHYHGQLPPEMQQQPLADVLAQTERYVMDTYWPALLRGQTIPDEEARRIATVLARHTGLPEDLWVESNLRIDPSRFRAEVLDGTDEVVGRFDARYVLPHLEPASPFPAGDDPSYALVHGAFASGIHQLFDRLGYESDLEYEVLNGGRWDFESENRYLETASRLERAMNSNPSMKVFVASGVYDLATPYFAARHVVRHVFSPDGQQRFTFADFESGHMMFVHRESLESLRTQLGNWYTD